MQVFIETDSRVKVTVTDPDTGAPITDASPVTGRVVDLANVLVTGSAFTLAHDTGGIYRGEIPNSVVYTRGNTYEVEVKIVRSGKQTTVRARAVADFAGIRQVYN